MLKSVGKPGQRCKMNASEIQMIFTYLVSLCLTKMGKEHTRLPLVTFESPAEGRRCLPKGKTLAHSTFKCRLKCQGLQGPADWSTAFPGHSPPPCHGWVTEVGSVNYSVSGMIFFFSVDDYFDVIWKSFLKKVHFFFIKNNSWASRTLEKGIKGQRKFLPPRDYHW